MSQLGLPEVPDSMRLDKPQLPHQDFQTPLERLLADLRAAVMGTTHDYTVGSLWRAILLLAVPMVLEMSMQSVFAVVDVFFVGKLGSEAVAVVGMTDSILTLVFALAMGLSMGTTALVARRMGEKDAKGAADAAVQALALGGAVSLVTGTLGVLLAEPLLTWVGAASSMAKSGAGFTAIILGGNLTVIWLFLINAVFRGAGDAAIAMRALWLANLINIILDPILIFGWGFFPELGLEGAAWATNIGRGMGVLYQISRLYRGSGRLRIGLHQLQLDLDIMRRLVRVSAMGVLQILIGTSSWLAVMRILSGFGGPALAGYTIAVRIIMFVLLPSWGMGNAAATLVGQNLGAGKPERAERSVRITAFSNMIFLGGVAILFNIFAEPAVAVFSPDPMVVAVGTDCLRVVSLSYVFMAFGMVTVQAFNGAGDTTTPTWINLFCYWFLQIPLAYLLSLVAGPRGVFVAIAIVQSILAAVAVWFFRRGRWKSRTL